MRYHLISIWSICYFTSFHAFWCKWRCTSSPVIFWGVLLWRINTYNTHAYEQTHTQSHTHVIAILFWCCIMLFWVWSNFTWTTYLGSRDREVWPMASLAVCHQPKDLCTAAVRMLRNCWATVVLWWATWSFASLRKRENYWIHLGLEANAHYSANWDGQILLLIIQWQLMADVTNHYCKILQNYVRVAACVFCCVLSFNPPKPWPSKPL